MQSEKHKFYIKIELIQGTITYRKCQIDSMRSSLVFKLRTTETLSLVYISILFIESNLVLRVRTR